MFEYKKDQIGSTRWPPALLLAAKENTRYDMSGRLELSRSTICPACGQGRAWLVRVDIGRGGYVAHLGEACANRVALYMCVRHFREHMRRARGMTYSELWRHYETIQVGEGGRGRVRCLTVHRAQALTTKLLVDSLSAWHGAASDRTRVMLPKTEGCLPVDDIGEEEEEEEEAPSPPPAPKRQRRRVIEDD